MTERTRLKEFLDRPVVRNTILGVILFNAILLGMETSQTLMDRWGPIIRLLDKACLAVFVVEIGLKLVAYRLSFFRSGWNSSISPSSGWRWCPVPRPSACCAPFASCASCASSRLPRRLRRVVEGFITALPGMGSVFLLMALIFYIGAVMATKLFGQSFPDWFGTLGLSAYSLFQIMTLESWSMGIVRPVMETYPYAWAFFVPFIMVTTFAVVNLLVGLIVNSMQDAHAEEANTATDAYRDEVAPSPRCRPRSSWRPRTCPRGWPGR
jgi:voltage-gated sodium channel